MSPTLGIITINYNRPLVLRLWCAMIQRLRRDLDMFIPAVVVSEEEDKATCQSYHVWHITQENKPVTSKFNTAFKYMQSLGVDYVTIMGSDNSFSSEFLRSQIVSMEKGIDLIGINTLHFYAGDGQYRGEMVKLTSKMILGVAKTVSKNVLDQCDWILWDQVKNWGMDAIANKTITKYAKTKEIIEGMVVDIKTKTNLNSYRIWGKRLPQIPAQRFYEILSEEELQILQTL